MLINLESWKLVSTAIQPMWREYRFCGTSTIYHRRYALLYYLLQDLTQQGSGTCVTTSASTAVTLLKTSAARNRRKCERSEWLSYQISDSQTKLSHSAMARRQGGTWVKNNKSHDALVSLFNSGNFFLKHVELILCKERQQNWKRSNTFKTCRYGKNVYIRSNLTSLKIHEIQDGRKWRHHMRIVKK